MSTYHSTIFLCSLLALLIGVTACETAESEEEPQEEDLRAQAERIATEYIYVDGHVDIPWKMSRYEHDISEHAPWADFDYPRAKEGGVEAPFTSIYLSAEYQDEPGASKELADELIDMMEGVAEDHPDRFAIPHSVQDVREHFEEGLVSLPLGMENGSGIEDDLDNLQHFYDRGIRYVTLAHSRDNHISDSSYEDTATHGGLSDFGLEVVDEMNRLGIMVDISHISDNAAHDVLDRTQVPVIASHSSVREFTPGWERNINDELMERVAENDGVVMICFGSSFLSNDYREEQSAIEAQIDEELEEEGLDPDSDEGRDFFYEQRRAHPVGSVADVADHIDYAVELMGVEHVGLGSDWDGVFGLPEGLQDASEFPNLVEELLERGYTEEEIQLIMGENVLRVWSEVEEFASNAQAEAAN